MLGLDHNDLMTTGALGYIHVHECAQVHQLP